MGFAAGLARKNLVQHPGRTTFSILGIAVGIATVVLVFTLDHNTMVGRKKIADRNWQADVEVRPKRGLENVRGELGDTPGVERISAHFQQDGLFRAGAGTRKPVRLFAIEAEAAPELGVYYLREGEHLDVAAVRPECLVGSKLAEQYGISVGDTVYIAQPLRRAKKVCVEGELQELGEPTPEPIDFPHRVAGVLEPELLGRRSGGNVVVVDYENGRELYGDTLIRESFWVKKDPTVDVERLQTNLGERFSFSVSEGAVVGQTADERAFRNGVRLAGLFALVLGLYVIFHTLSMSLVERVREVGLMNALGATRRQIARIFFGEACFIAITGGLLGAGAGLLMARTLLRNGVSTIGVGQRIFTFEVPWEIVGPLSGVGIGIALIGSIYPLLRAKRTNIAAALRGEDVGQASSGVHRGFQLFTAILLTVILPGLYLVIAPVIGEVDETFLGVILGGIGVLALLVGVPMLVPSILAAVCARITRPFSDWWPLAGLLASRSIQHSPTRISASVAAIALVTAAFVGLKGMTNSLRGEVEVWAGAAVEGKLWVRGLPDVTYDELHAALGPDAGVLGIEAGDARVYNPFLILGLRPEELAGYGPCAQDPALLQSVAGGQGVILSKRVAQRYGYEVGDAIHLNTGGHGVQTFPVVGISDAYGYFFDPDERMYGIVGAEYVQRYFCLDTDTMSSAALKLADGVSPDDAITAVYAAFGESGDLNFRPGSAVLEWHVEDITRDFHLFDLILGLTALLAGLGVLNGQLLSALERWKEMGVLRALGMTHGQVAGMVLLESTVIGVIGALLGLAIGSVLTPLIVEALQVISSLPLPHRTAGPWLAWSLAGAVSLTVLAGLYPIWRMNRFDAVRAVRTG